MVSTFNGPGQANPALIVGLLVSIFTFCEFLTGAGWARVSDTLGRKATLLIGALAAMTLSIGFGLCESVFAAVAIRALAGITNPNVGVVQTCVGELVKKKEHQGKNHDSQSQPQARTDIGTVASKSLLNRAVPTRPWVR